MIGVADEDWTEIFSPSAREMRDPQAIFAGKTQNRNPPSPSARYRIGSSERFQETWEPIGLCHVRRLASNRHFRAFSEIPPGGSVLHPDR